MHSQFLYLSCMPLVSVTSHASAASPWHRRHHNHQEAIATTTGCSGESCPYPQPSSSACSGDSCAYPQYSSSACMGESCAYPQASTVVAADTWPTTTSAAVYDGALEDRANDKAAMKPVATTDASAGPYHLPVHRVAVDPPNSANPPSSGTESLVATTDNSSETTSSVAGASVNSKKGAGVWAVKNLTEMVTEIGATWAYDWSDRPKTSFTGYWASSLPLNVDLVAMIDSKSDFAALKSSSYKEIIGYNEPDAQAAPVSWEDAATQWPQVVATGKRIGSPAPANTKLVPGDWFYEFMANISVAGSHIDFICLHYYSPDGNVTTFQQYIEGIYNMYKKPIWVTEWAYVDYSKNPPHVPSDSTVLTTYMKSAVAMLEDLSYVERYAWFAVPWSSVQPATNMFDEFGNITPIGAAYSTL